MKLLSKIFKTLGLIFIFVLLTTLYGCEMTDVSGNQLLTPNFTMFHEDKNITVFIEEIENADSYYLYVYENDGIKNKFSVTPDQALMGYTVYLGYGDFELAVQALDSTNIYSSSIVSERKQITLNENTLPHQHVFIDGKCECGLTESKYSITYVLNGGSISSDAPVFYSAGETVFLMEPTKDNFIFSGWYLNSDFSGEQISVISNKTKGNITIYAKWEDDSFEYTGYYEDANDLEGASLKQTLRTIITTGFKTVTYGDLRYKLAYTDASLTDSSKVVLVYSHHEVSGSWDGGSTWNREHVWPKSQGWFNEAGAGCDIHHIRPEDPTVNSTRGNLPFGEVNNGSAIKCCGEIVAYRSSAYFEPFDEYKGDVARIIFYMLVRYSESDSYSITKVAQSMDMLLEWHEADPVDAFEIQRNERCYSVQNNRNPFIDHPEFADMIWG